MAIPKGHRKTLDVIRHAASSGDLALMQCTDNATGKPVTVLCAVNRDEDGGYQMAPLAQLFNDNPYDLLTPPA